MCGSDSDGEVDSAGGRLTLLLVDDPIDSVTSLNVRIQSIEVHGNGPPRELTLNQEVVEHPVNILELENGVFATLVNGNDNENVLPTGTYGNLKIHITEASITLPDNPNEEIPATVPPDKFNVGGPFTINEGEITELYLVFHANNSLHKTTEDGYTVHPSLKLISKTVSGSITGYVFPVPVEGGFTKVKVFANRGDTESEVTTFADEATGFFELVPLREGTHEISVEWLTLDGEEVDECRLRVHGDEDVVAEQVTNIQETITLDGGDPC
jgi:hypothetical protein